MKHIIREGHHGVVAVTGAGGFVGRALAGELCKRLRPVRPIVRGSSTLADAGHVTVNDIGPDTDWRCALTGVESVIHCAACVHAMSDRAGNLSTELHRVNVAGSRRLAEQAVAFGVRRLVYISSVKVNGEHTLLGSAFSERDIPAPWDAYALSKWEAEQALWDVAKASDLEVVVVRPPLVYGPGVRANFARLVQWVRREIPLPFGAVKNRRSLIGLDNLVDLLIRCVEHPRAVGQTFLVSDGEDLSTPDLIRRLAHAMGRPARLLSCPSGLMLTAASLLGKSGEAERLIGSLRVDIRHTCQVLDWSPPVSVDEGLARVVAEL